MNPIGLIYFVLIVLALIYLAVVVGMTRLLGILERRLGKSDGK